MIRRVQEMVEHIKAAPHRRKFRVYSIVGIFMVLCFEHTAFAFVASIGWTVHGVFWLMSED